MQLLHTYTNNNHKSFICQIRGEGRGEGGGFKRIIGGGCSDRKYMVLGRVGEVPKVQKNMT